MSFIKSRIFCWNNCRFELYTYIWLMHLAETLSLRSDSPSFRCPTLLQNNCLLLLLTKMRSFPITEPKKVTAECARNCHLLPTNISPHNATHQTTNTQGWHHVANRTPCENFWLGVTWLGTKCVLALAGRSFACSPSADGSSEIIRLSVTIS